ncbi:small multi-drug export protein [Paenibacillus hodogayensis]|uniref:Small multi-drug export protein n=1 Tax=Paenibacillus hodogayensis TaxID=279208 RepID=A0ABV5VY84_9BACL
MIDIAKWISVLGTSVLELWAAIPLGFALGLHPVVTGVLSALGSALSALIVVTVGGPLRRWMVRRWENKKKSGKKGSMAVIWDKYGVIGLGLLSPIITGAPLGAVIGVSLGAKSPRLLVWMSVGIVVWTVLLTAAVAFGVASFM